MFRWLLFFTVMSACSSQSASIQSSLLLGGTYKYLALGDSYTIGESVKEADRWSVILGELLKEQSLELKNIDIIARTGWTTSELQAAIATANPRSDYDLVSLLIGVNNQYRGQSLEKYRIEFVELLKSSIKFANGRSERVFVLSVPDWSVTPFANGTDKAKTAREIDNFNAVAKEECAKRNIPFIDITPLSRKAATDIRLLANDNLHFSGTMHRQWATLALPTVVKLLKK